MNVLVVEDHAPTRAAIIQLLTSRGGLDVTGAATVTEALARVAEPDASYRVALVDLHLGASTGLELVPALSSLGIACVMLTISDAEADVSEALRLGAVGYLLKDDPPATILQAIADADAGQHPISSGVTRYLIPRPGAAEGAVRARGLTPREVEVLTALARGLTYAESAEALGCAPSTVQSHVKSLYGKLDVNSKTEACAWAYSVGLVE